LPPPPALLVLLPPVPVVVPLAASFDEQAVHVAIVRTHANKRILDV